MRRTWWVVIALACVLAAGAIRIVITERNRPPDEVQIRELMAKGEAAIESKDVAGAMSCIAKDYTDNNGLTYDDLRAEVRTYFMQKCNYDVEVRDTRIRAAKRTAMVSTHATVYAVYDGGGWEKLLDRTIDMILHKQDARRWLVIPVKRWRVTDIAGLPTESELMELQP